MVKFQKERAFSSAVEEIKEDMLAAAAQARVSDIHIDPELHEYLIRFRVDGMLQTWTRGPMAEYENLVSLLKVASELDITLRHVPQDGHFRWATNLNPEDSSSALDIRTSFFPVLYGEAVVLRLLNRADFLIDLKELFTEPADYQMLEKLIHRPYGMALIVGPANSGKTTTLYSILNELSNEKRNIITLEDPVEYYLPLIRQSQVNEFEFNLALGLKSILRQDPDLMMVGEIRDPESAEIALRTALTGRLFFSTLHAGDSVGAISRLLDMELKKDLISYALSGIISQRLVRKICDDCKVSYTPDANVLKDLGVESTGKFFKGKGCEACMQTGFRGRVGLFEILIIDEDLQRMIIERPPTSELRAAAKEKGLKTLRADGIKKIHAGITTPEEVLRSTA